MPSRQDENGIYRDIIHPIDPEAREKLENEILTAYENYAALMNVLEENDSWNDEKGLSKLLGPFLKT